MSFETPQFNKPKSPEEEHCIDMEEPIAYVEELRKMLAEMKIKLKQLQENPEKNSKSIKKLENQIEEIDEQLGMWDEVEGIN